MIYPHKLLLQKKSICTKMGNVENYKLHAQELKNTKKTSTIHHINRIKKILQTFKTNLNKYH